MLERLLKYPGFVYHIGGRYYYLGKWICKECCETEVSDCVVMYEMCSQTEEEAEAGTYFHKIRAHSDFALEVPYNPAKIQESLAALLNELAETEQESLSRQISLFEQSHVKYCGPLPSLV